MSGTLPDTQVQDSQDSVDASRKQSKDYKMVRFFEEDELKVLEAVRDRPSLYNKKHKDYKNAHMREQHYADVAGDCNLPSKYIY